MLSKMQYITYTNAATHLDFCINGFPIINSRAIYVVIGYYIIVHIV